MVESLKEPSHEALKVKPEYAALCTHLTSEEYAALKESIMKEGLWIPLVVNPDSCNKHKIGTER